MAGSDHEASTSSSSGEVEEEVSSEASKSESEPDKSSKKTQPPSDELNSQPKSEIDKTPETPQLPEPSTKSVASKPMDDDQLRKPRSKNPTSRDSPPPLTQSTGKRPAVEDEGIDLKRIKRNTDVEVEVDNGGEKKQLFQRLWSEDNEIELIQGMINYVKEKGKDPLADINDFHEFVKKSLHVDVNHTQVLNKARRLKKKFKDNEARAAKGKVRSLSNPHEKKMYELSINLWGNGNVVMNYGTKKVNAKVNETPKSNKVHKAVGSGNGNVGIAVTASEVESKVVRVQPVRSGHGFDHLGSMGILITDEAIINKGLEMVSGAKKVEMVERWKKLKIQELEHFLKKVDILKEQAEVVLNAIANSGAK